MLVHSVYFYLKETVSDFEKAEFRSSVESLAKIDTIHTFYLGTPAATPDRPIIEKGYAIAMTILFQNHGRSQHLPGTPHTPGIHPNKQGSLGKSGHL